MRKILSIIIILIFLLSTSLILPYKVEASPGIHYINQLPYMVESALLPTFNFKDTLFKNHTLSIRVESVNKTTGEVVINGADTRKPTIPFTWDWGDGSITTAFFPQNHIYTNTSQNYILKVTSHYSDGSSDHTETLITFSDNFESYVAGTKPSNWEFWFNQNGKIVSGISVSGSKSLWLHGSYSWAVHAVRRFSSNADIIGYQVYIMVAGYGHYPQRSTAAVLFTKKTSSTTSQWYASVYFKGDGYIYAGSKKLMPYRPNTWYKIKGIWNRKNQKYTVYINDKLVATDVPETHAGAYQIDGLSLDSDWGEEDCYFDDVKVFEVELSSNISGGNIMFKTLWRVPIKDNLPFSADVGDVDGDGIPDIAIVPYDWHSLAPGTNNTLEVIRSDGKILWSKSILIEGAVVGLSDIDGDGCSEVLVAGTPTDGSSDAVVYAFDDNGKELWVFHGRDGTYGHIGWLIFTNLDNDPYPEIFAVNAGWSSQVSYALDNDGRLLWKFHGYENDHALLGDVTGDGKDNIILLTNLGFRVQAINSVGKLIWEYKSDSYNNVGVLGDLTGDGIDDIIVCEVSNDWANVNKLYVLRNNGSFYWSHQFNKGMGNGPTVPVLVDVNNDGLNDLLLGANKRIYAISNNGKVFWVSNATFEKSPQIVKYDINRDGKKELIFEDNNKIYEVKRTGEIKELAALPNNSHLIIRTGYSPIGKSKDILLQADVNKDGYKELIVSEKINGKYYVAALEPESVNLTSKRENPTIVSVPNTQYSVAGSTLGYTINITNNDPSSFGASTFSLAYSVPAGWLASLSKTKISLNPGETVSIILSVSSPLDANPGNYTISITAVNVNDTRYRSSTSVIYSVSSNNPSAKIDIEEFSKKVYTVDDIIPFNIYVENTGESDWNFFITLIVISPDPTSGSRTVFRKVSSLYLSKNSEKKISINWNIPDNIYPGTYSIIVEITDKYLMSNVKASVLDSKAIPVAFMIDTHTSYVEAAPGYNNLLKKSFWTIHIHIDKKDINMFKKLAHAYNNTATGNFTYYINLGDLYLMLRTVTNHTDNISKLAPLFNYMIEVPTHETSVDITIIQTSSTTGRYFDTAPVNLYPTWVKGKILNLIVSEAIKQAIGSWASIILKVIEASKWIRPIDPSMFKAAYSWYIVFKVPNTVKVDVLNQANAVMHIEKPFLVRVKLTDLKTGLPVKGADIKGVIQEHFLFLPVETHVISLKDSGNGVYEGWWMPNAGLWSEAEITIIVIKPPENGERGYSGAVTFHVFRTIFNTIQPSKSYMRKSMPHIPI